MRRPLGCMTFSALFAAILVAIVIAAAAVATGNGIFSPGALSAVAFGSPVGDATSHADLSGRCEACHAPAWSSETMADRCLKCHAQVRTEVSTASGLHGRLDTDASNCRACHTDHRGAAASVTLADPSVFPHDRTGYALTAHPMNGASGSVGCRDCHPASPVSFTAPTCAGCHRARDAAYMAEHEATFGTTCLGCHDGKDTYGAKFAHASYPLTGHHEGAKCGTCHVQSTTLAALRTTSTACVDCHLAKDIHQGRLGTDCAECHSPAGWEGATIDHDRTRYPLVGKHVGVLCESCHVQRHWTGIGETCASCHAKDDPHNGQFKGDCASCHASTGWKDVTFDHATTGFALKGGHATPACAACHANGRFAGTPTTCIACHAKDDRHNGSFGKDCAACHKVTTWGDWTFDHSRTAFQLTGAHRGVSCQACHKGALFKDTPKSCAACHAKPASHGSAFKGSCSSCHSTKAWQPATFNHDKSAFPLTGAHRGVSCQKCHIGGLLKGTPKSCSSCHTKPASHPSTFGNGCGACHSTKAWKPASFNHDKSGFPLTGAHRGISCQKCHIGGLFKGTPKNCSACHNKPKTHGSGFNSCGSCHSTSHWKPAKFNASHTFPLRHGGAGGICTKCHVSVWANYTCSKCHSNSSMTEHHKEVSGFSLTNCVKCHPTGHGD